MFDNDDAWLILFLLLYSAQEQGKEFNVHDMLDQEKADTQYVNNCPNVEREQDMHANIPFCKLDGEMCNMQCQNRKNYNAYNERRDA